MENDYVSNYWHVYSDGKQADIPFCSDEEKVFAMNSVAIVAFQTSVRVLCVTVNDTHLHAVVYGENGDRFREEMRKRGNKLSNSYFGKSLRKVDLHCRLKVASKMMREGFGSKSEGFAKALYLSLDDLKTLL